MSKLQELLVQNNFLVFLPVELTETDLANPKNVFRAEGNYNISFRNNRPLYEARALNERFFVCGNAHMLIIVGNYSILA